MEWIVEADTMGNVISGHRVCFKRFIRCKDCKYYDPSIEYNGVRLEADCMLHEWYRVEPTEHDFCSRGVRKDV